MGALCIVCPPSALRAFHRAGVRLDTNWWGCTLRSLFGCVMLYVFSNHHLMFVIVI